MVEIPLCILAFQLPLVLGLRVMGILFGLILALFQLSFYFKLAGIERIFSWNLNTEIYKSDLNGNTQTKNGHVYEIVMLLNSAESD